jgi:tetratricopeptide (TPR) repeat protein
MTTPGNNAGAQQLREAATRLLTLDYFAALSVSRAATPDDVKKAFLEAVKAWHPDRVPPGLDELKPLFGKVFARLELARATVSDPERRARYIVELAKPTTAATAGDLSSAEATLEFRKAEGLLKKNDAVQAEQHLRRAVQLAPANVEYQILLVWLQVKPDSTPARLGELVLELGRLIERDPRAERAYFYRGQLEKRLERTREAMADFARAAELNPSNVDAQRELRIYKMRQERGAPTGAQRSETAAGEGGVGGFFKKLFKR